MINKFIHKISYVFGIAICLVWILWSYIEKGYYNNYVEGHFPLHIIVYIFPWIVIFTIIRHYIKNK